MSDDRARERVEAAATLILGRTAPAAAEALEAAGMLADPAGHHREAAARWELGEAIIAKERAEADRAAEYRRYAQEADRAEELEAEVARLRAERCEHAKCPGGSLCCCQANADRVLAAEAENERLRAQVQAVRELADRWARMAGEAMHVEDREWLASASKSLGAALDGVSDGGE